MAMTLDHAKRRNEILDAIHFSIGFCGTKDSVIRELEICIRCLQKIDAPYAINVLQNTIGRIESTDMLDDRAVFTAEMTLYSLGYSDKN